MVQCVKSGDEITNNLVNRTMAFDKFSTDILMIDTSLEHFLSARFMIAQMDRQDKPHLR